MGQTVSTDAFRLVGQDEPHRSRRKEILKKYPAMRDLYGPDIRLFYSVVVLLVLQLSLASQAHAMPTWLFFIIAYVVGGTLAHSLSLAIHELSHNLAFETPIMNEILSLVANFGHGLPSALTFKKYHLEHHYYQGYDQIDTDIPSEFEGRIFHNTFLKIIWCLLQPLFYALRPIITRPLPPTKMEIVNSLVIISFDVLICNFFTKWALIYLITSTLLGMGIHPVAGHFIAEHYQFILGQETYSYYGPLNYVCFNVGYHNEHHDFPKVSGFRLPLVKAMAPEYYDERWKSWDGTGLVVHESWCRVIYDYITRPDMGPFSRVKRDKSQSSIKKAA